MAGSVAQRIVKEGLAADPHPKLSLAKPGDPRLILTPRARVAELADAPDLGSGVLGRGGSSPLSRTFSYSFSSVHSECLLFHGAPYYSSRWSASR